MKSEYIALKSTVQSPGWPILEELWLAQVTRIEEARDKAAKRNSESAWRYAAGQEYGFKLAMSMAARALKDMEKEDENSGQESTYEGILKAIKGDKP